MKTLRNLLVIGGLLLSAGVLVAAEINNLFPTDASNIDRFPEGMPLSNLNDGARALEALIARWHIDAGGRIDSTGTDPHFVVAASQTITAYYDGLEIAFTAHTTNADGPATLNVDSVGASTMKKTTDEGLIDLAASDIPLGAVVTVVYDDLNSQWVLTSGGQSGQFLKIANDLSDVTLAASARANISAQQDVITTRGDIVRGSSDAEAERLALGSNGQIITSDGTDIAWAATSTVMLAPGIIVQKVNTITGAVTTGTTQMPFDDTIPQNGEGEQYMTLAITPNSTANILRIDVVFLGSGSIAGGLSAALFQDSTASALAANEVATNTSHITPVTFTHWMTAGTISSTTFNVRAGLNGAGTTTFNGTGGARKFGGVAASSITITEITP